MRFRVGSAAPFLIVFTLASTIPQVFAGKKPASGDAATNEQKRAAHALNRLAFGPRPGDIQRVAAMGVDNWIDLQLHPEKISDSAVESRLEPFRTLRMSAHQMVEEFPDNQMIRQVREGKKPMPNDAAKRAIYDVQIARMDERELKKQQQQPATNAKSAPAPQQDAAMMPEKDGPTAKDESSAKDGPNASEGAKTEAELAAAAAAAGDSESGGAMNAMSAPAVAPGASNAAASSSAASNSMTPPDPPPTPVGVNNAFSKAKTVNDPDAKVREERLYADLEVQQLADLAPDQRYKKILAMPADQQYAFAEELRGGKGQDFLAGLDPRQKETLLAMNNPESVVTDELVQAKLLRAIYSERQLEEVMTDFWFNHFNVFVNKGADRILLTSYEQDVIRPHAMGKFEDLLVATAKSPAMLFYLDNWLSEGPNSMQALGIPAHPGRYGPYRYPPPNPNAKRKANNGLNENYGRELLELHTLSVNGGYSQRDVTEVAKVFTGWTIDKPNEGGNFQFDARKHEPGPKFVLGHRIKPKGEDEGREVLHMLATSPQTAHFISLKLAERFVSDNPPPALVDRMAKTFLKKKGDIREVLSTLFHSPEFWSDDAYRAKVKTPLEFVVSAARATGADVDDAMPLARQLNNMGMPLYGAQPPTGYSMKAETWVSSSALLNRMNFALALTGGKVRGTKVDAAQLAGDSAAPGAPTDAPLILSALEAKVLAADVSKQTHDSIVAQVEAPPNGMQAANAKPQNKPSVPRPPDASMIAGLLLGSPEFQRR